MAEIDNEARVTLRLPVSLRDRLAEAASKSGRSMNAEMVARLDLTFEGDERIWDNVNRLEDLVADLQRRMQQLEPRVEALYERFPWDEASR